ncbi:MAG: dolichol kinase [Nitrososphaerota archaeon]
MWETPTLNEIIYAGILFGWVVFVTLFLCRKIYEVMLRRGAPHNVAVYYNRKIIHILTGGLVAVLVPLLFNSYLPIAVLVAVLAIGNLLPHIRGKIYHWYQVPENMFEVHFIIMWGLFMGLGFYLNNLSLGVLPVIFMSVGDGITGLVRNTIYKRRTKSWWGNIAMGAFCIPVGLFVMGLSGAIAGAGASIVEKFELGKIDDNITVPLLSFLLMVILPWLGVP